MNEPTQEQIKKLWEWCGFREECVERAARVDCGQTLRVVFCPDDSVIEDYLPLDLTNLFKWAVPQVVRKLADTDLSSDEEAMSKLFELWLKIYWTPSPEPLSIQDALFRAIWQVIEKEVPWQHKLESDS